MPIKVDMSHEVPDWSAQSSLPPERPGQCATCAIAIVDRMSKQSCLLEILHQMLSEC